MALIQGAWARSRVSPLFIRLLFNFLFWRSRFRARAGGKESPLPGDRSLIQQRQRGKTGARGTFPPPPPETGISRRVSRSFAHTWRIVAATGRLARVCVYMGRLKIIAAGEGEARACFMRTRALFLLKVQGAFRKWVALQCCSVLVVCNKSVCDCGM